ncbi:MAG: hypothetical protein ACE5LX_05735, partial [Nitrospinota bacterium]
MFQEQRQLILAIGEDSSTLRSLEKLSDSNCVLQLADNREKALEILAREPIDLVICRLNGAAGGGLE